MMGTPGRSEDAFHAAARWQHLAGPRFAFMKMQTSSPFLCVAGD